MTSNEAIKILIRNGFVGGYYGPGWKSVNNIISFMERYPRGKGISSNDINKLNLYEACAIINKEYSRTKSYVSL